MFFVGFFCILFGTILYSLKEAKVQEDNLKSDESNKIINKTNDDSLNNIQIVKI